MSMEPSAEAGPSILSSNNAPSTPEQPKARRRSWFGFGSPVTPTSAKRDSSPVLEHELGAIGGSNSAASSSKTVNQVEVDKTRAGEGAEEELLTIDGDPEQTIKKRHRRKSSHGAGGEVMRLADLSRTPTVRKASATSLAADEDENTRGPSPTRFPRRFLRTASDRDNELIPPTFDTTPRNISAPLILPASSIPRRSSSIPPRPLAFASSDSFEKLQPPIPLERPLPPLPPPDPGESPPEIPSTIVVTPSSPHRTLRYEKSSPNLTNGDGSERSRSTSRSRSANRTPRQQSSRTSPIGLGLPGGLGEAPIVSDKPPPVPSKGKKGQAVSSPFPSRSPSPIPKIAFIEPDPPKDVDRDTPPSATGGKGTREKRSRSVSIFWGKSPTSSSTSKAGVSRPTSPEPSAAGARESLVDPAKSQGVLEWLGVRKTVKRRQSESKLKPGTTRIEIGSNRQSEQSSVSPVTDGQMTPSGSIDDIGGLTIRGPEDTGTARRPQIRGTASTTTVVPSTQGKLASLFSRRPSSSKGEENDDSRVPSPSDTRVIPTPEPRRDTTASSQSSLGLPPPIEVPTGPMLIPQNDMWTSSPTTEGEEVMFSPGSSAHWGPGMRPWMDGTAGNRSSTRSSISSPLGSLPESGFLDPMVPPAFMDKVVKEGRGRSRSDAPRPQTDRDFDHRTHPHLATAVSSDGLKASSSAGSLQPSPLTPTRPTLGVRSNSGNSAMIGRMRNVFSKNSTRGRSNTLSRQSSSDVDEFGGLRPQDDWTGGVRMRPSSSSSSEIVSPVGARARSPVAGLAHPTLLGLHEDEGLFLNDPPERSARSSLASSAKSIPHAESKTTSVEIQRTPSAINQANRVRASTISSGPTSYSFLPPPVPTIFPGAATPPRRRPSVMQRISHGKFGTTSSPKPPATLFPLPPRSSGSTPSSVTVESGSGDEHGSIVLSPGASPRPSAGGSQVTPSSSTTKQAVTREDDETPEMWLKKIVNVVDRSEISNVLAASNDDFHNEALKLYMTSLDFTHNALDVALRRLLMQISLPRETQQIDRIIEAFAVRYEACEAGLFVQKDNTYVLAFSMMMLHTDAFNKHNKYKMNKADYVRNTRMDGVPAPVLEAFFDNITFTPFVFIEDDAVFRRSVMDSDVNTPPPLGSTPTFAGSMMPKNLGKVDVYDMICRGSLGGLRVDVEQYVPVQNPFSSFGTRPFLDVVVLHDAFTSAHSLRITPSSRRGPALLPGKITSTPAKSTPDSLEMTLKVTKVGLLSRKEEFVDSNKKNRKWKSWSVILTGSQLLFFKDPSWALTLLEQASSSDGASSQLLLPLMTTFKPDEVFPVKDCFAVYDREFTQYANTFRFIMPLGRQYLMQASDEFEMNEWIGLINYASAFKTADVRMRGSAMPRDRIVLAGAAAAASHKREVNDVLDHKDGAVTPRKAVFGEVSSESDVVAALQAVQDSEAERQQTIKVDAKGRNATVDVLGANDLAVDEGEQLEDVFDIVKAELAAGRGGATKKTPVGTLDGVKNRPRHDSTASAHATRTEAIEFQIKAFESRLAPLTEALNDDLRIIRNLAILTPFQKSTRDRIAVSIPPIAARIRQNRLQVTQLELWITVLRQDLEREDRDWARLRHVALQAASKSLHDPKGVKAVVEDVNSSTEPVAIPQLALPIQDRVGEEDRGGDGDIRLGSSPGELPEIIRRPSDDADHKDRPALARKISAGSNTAAAMGRPELRRATSEDLAATSIRARQDNSPQVDSGTGNSTPVIFQHSDGDEDFNQATIKARQQLAKEEAEDWQSTRAARRVSLAAIPPGEMGKLSDRIQRRASGRRDPLDGGHGGEVGNGLHGGSGETIQRGI